MNVAIELPEDIARLLQASWKDRPRRALEAIALEGYRTQALTRGQVGRLLGADSGDVNRPFRGNVNKSERSDAGTCDDA
jgi:hypothetical protein